jgi:hypothetical protein
MESFQRYVTRVAWTRPNPDMVENYNQTSQDCVAHFSGSAFSSLHEENPTINHRDATTTDPWDQYYLDEFENANSSETILQRTEANTEMLKKNREAQDLIDRIVQQYLPMETSSNSAHSPPENESAVTFQSFLGEGSPLMQRSTPQNSRIDANSDHFSVSSTVQPIGPCRPSVDTSIIANYFLNNALQRAAEQILISPVNTGYSSSSDPTGTNSLFSDA